MTRSQKLTVRLSEIRQKLNELLGVEERTDGQNATMDQLMAEAVKLEPELRAAIVAEGEGQTTETTDTEIDAAERERRELRSKSRFHRFVAAALAHGDAGRVDGAEAELAAAEGCPGLVPLTIIGPTTEQRQAEHRAALETRAVTPAPADSDVPHTHASIVPALFDRSVAPFLGIEMPTVGTGVQSYPVISTSVKGGMVAEDGDAAETAGAYTVTDADPRRLTGAFRIRKEDIAKLPVLEESLRENLSMVLSDEFDKQGVNGDGTEPNLNGLLAQLTDPAAPAANAETFGRYVTAFASHVDGLFATTLADVRALVGPHTYRHAAGVFRSNQDSMTAEAWIQSRTGGMRVTRRLADPASNVQQAIIRRANPAGDRVAVAPVWMGLELIRDPYTAAGKGQVVVTGTVLVGGVVLLRSGAFVQDSFRPA